MKKIDPPEHKRILLDLLAYVDKICRDNNIKYSLLGGSLIGAIRHKGIIPWDDDIDIVLMPEEYNKLIRALKQQDNKSYKLLDPHHRKDYLYPFAKLVNTKTAVFEKGIRRPLDYGIYIDIFQYHYAPNTAFMRYCHYQKLRIAKMLLSANLAKKNKGTSHKIILRKRLIKLLGEKRVREYYASLCNNKNKTNYIISNWPAYGCKKEFMKSSWMNNYEDTKFENITAMISSHYHDILTTTFGNYMQCPPPRATSFESQYGGLLEIAMKKKIPIGLLNTATSLLLQVIAIINGFIVPHIILNHFGSEANGLVSSLGQFLNYISLLEGGVNGVIMASLYTPLANKHREKISSIISTSQKFFRKISYIFIAYTICLACLYPLFSNTGFGYGFVCTMTFILSIKIFSQYCFSLAYQNLLTASKRGYIISLSKICFILLDLVCILLVVNLSPNLLLLELFSALTYLVQPLIFSIAVKKHFNLNRNAPVDNELIKNRWNGLSINIAYFIHSNTDIAMLTIFANLQTVSIYSVYCLIGSGINKIIGSITAAISPSIGNLYAIGDKEKLNGRFDLYEYITFILVFFLFGIAALLITPFVMIYTSNISDANYYQPLFGILLIIAEAIYAIRAPYVNLAYNAGKFKDITKHAYIEAALNIIISIVLINRLGLAGVAIGTLVAMLYRTSFQIWYLKRHLIHRPISKFLKRFALLLAPTLTILLLCYYSFPITDYSLKDWLIHAVVYGLSALIGLALSSIIFFKKDLVALKNYLRHK